MKQPLVSRTSNMKNALLALALLAAPAFGDNWKVGPPPYMSLQDAINAAQSSDTIVLQPGRYFDVDLQEKSLRFLGPPAATTKGAWLSGVIGPIGLFPEFVDITFNAATFVLPSPGMGGERLRFTRCRFFSSSVEDTAIIIHLSACALFGSTVGGDQVYANGTYFGGGIVRAGYGFDMSNSSSYGTKFVLFNVDGQGGSPNSHVIDCVFAGDFRFDLRSTFMTIESSTFADPGVIDFDSIWGYFGGNYILHLVGNDYPQGLPALNLSGATQVVITP